MGYSVAPSSVVEITTDKITFFRYFDKEYLHEHYVILGKSMNQIAREKGCVRSTVRTALTELGFKTKDRKELHCNKGQVPFGFRVVHGNLVPHLGEKVVLDRMAEMKSSGASYGDIATWLNSKQIPTKNRAGQWDRPTIYKILKTQAVGPKVEHTKNTI